MSKQLTRKQAEAALNAIKAQFASHIAAGYDGPTLHEPGTHTSGWSIAWVDGPYEWTYRAFQGGFDEEMYFMARDAGATEEQARTTATTAGVPVPRNVFPEPVNSSVLGLYREV